MLLKLERDEEALVSLRRAIELQPNYADACYNLAVCHSLMGQAKPALENLQKAIHLNPRYRAEAKVDPDFEELAASPRFQKLINE
jgi:tetratricopeptide (TPR) repeat protein